MGRFVQVLDLDQPCNIAFEADGKLATTTGWGDRAAGRLPGGAGSSRPDAALGAWRPEVSSQMFSDRARRRTHLTRALEASLRRLGTDHIDLYQCHMPDAATPVDETMATLDDFVRSGKVRYIGCSNFTIGQIVEAQWAAARSNSTAIVSLQAHYSLVARDIEAEILPACSRHGIGVLAYSPLANGLLAGRYQRGEPPEPGSRLDQFLHFPHRAAARWAEATMTERNFGSPTPSPRSLRRAMSRRPPSRSGGSRSSPPSTRSSSDHARSTNCTVPSGASSSIFPRAPASCSTPRQRQRTVL